MARDIDKEVNDWLCTIHVLKIKISEGITLSMETAVTGDEIWMIEYPDEAGTSISKESAAILVAVANNPNAEFMFETYEMEKVDIKNTFGNVEK